MKRSLCTISTESHFYKVKALYESVCKMMPDLQISVLLVDAEPQSLAVELAEENVVLFGLNDVCLDGVGREIAEKYAGKRNADRLRWCLKPIFLKHLLDLGYEQLIYVDNDIYFFDSPGFLFDLLQQHAIILSPHWRTISPKNHEEEFSENFTDGLFNGGFVAVNPKGKSAMEWWAKACLHLCIKDRKRGFWDDQRYLDILPLRFEGVHILEHQGCNIAVWNRRDLLRTRVGNEVLINGKWPIIFIHFTNELFSEIFIYESDPELKEHAERYIQTLKKYKADFEIKIPGPPQVRGKWLHMKWIMQLYLRKTAKFLRSGRDKY